MVVDDDVDVHDFTCCALAGSSFVGKPLQLIQAFSGEEAKRLAGEHPDLALILLDLAMETRDAGLKVAEYIREELQNMRVRITLNTSLSDFAYERLGEENFHVNDYREKKEMSVTLLQTHVRLSLAAYRNMAAMEQHLKEMYKSAENEIRLIKLNKRIMEIGIALSAEKNLDSLLEMILEEAIGVSLADAATLYIKKGDCLYFKIFRNRSLNIKKGGTSGIPIELPPVPISRENVSAFAAITKQTINISDVYNATGFDFTGPERYDASTGYRSQSMLVVPMKNSRGEVIGVLQLINAMDAVSGKVISFSYDAVKFVESLASQAAVTITNIMMLKETEDLFNSVVKVMATAIDEKSPYSGGHIQRVAEMALELAKLVNEEKEGPLGVLNFTEAQLHEIYISGLMHDMGKVSTPEWIMDKATRLEKIFDRVHLVRERFLKIMNALKVEKLEQRIFMQAQGASKEEIETHEKDMDGKINGLKEDLEFVTRCNSPGELMDEEKTARIRRIASNTYMEDGQALPYLTDDEIKNLCIRKGSITEEEYAIMQNHASVTIRMLEHIPFVESLKNVPLYAGSHHERICGSGYPKGLKGDQIPIQARILALVDIFEALTAKDRPYKKPLSLEIALKILKEEVEAKHLDLNLFDLFLKTKFYERME